MPKTSMQTRALTVAPLRKRATKRQPQPHQMKRPWPWLPLAVGFLLGACLRADTNIRESIECLVDRSDVIAVYEVSSVSGPAQGEWSDVYQATLQLACSLRGEGAPQLTKTFYLDTTPDASAPRACAVKRGHKFVHFAISGVPADTDSHHRYYIGKNSLYLHNQARDADYGLAVTADFRILDSQEAILAAVRNRIAKGRHIPGTDRSYLINCIWPDKAPWLPRSRAAKTFVGLQIPRSSQDWHSFTPSGVQFRYNTRGPDILIIPIDLYHPYLGEIDRLYFR